MNLKDISPILYEPPNDHMETRMFGEAISVIVSSLQANLPACGHQLSNVADKLHGNLNALINGRKDVVEYFTGNGPIARKLIEQAAVFDMFHNALNLPRIENNIHQTITANYYEALHAKILNQFDFKPNISREKNGNSIPENVKLADELSHYLRTRIAQVKKLLITAPTHRCYPYDYLKAKSGIYGNYEKGDTVSEPCVVLRVEMPNGVIALFYNYIRSFGSNSEERLLFYHPHELAWVESNYRITFDGLKELFEAEYAKVIATVNVLSPEYDFWKELESDFDNIEQAMKFVYPPNPLRVEGEPISKVTLVERVVYCSEVRHDNYYVGENNYVAISYTKGIIECKLKYGSHWYITKYNDGTFTRTLTRWHKPEDGTASDASNVLIDWNEEGLTHLTRSTQIGIIQLVRQATKTFLEMKPLEKK